MSRRFLADLLRSVRGMVGAAVAAVTLYLMIVLVVVEAMSGWRHPYLGLLTFLVLPPVLLVSLLVMWSGVRAVRKRRDGSGR
jgi:hypothetical protein